MTRGLATATLVVLLAAPAAAQPSDHATVSGAVVDATTGEPVAGVTVADLERGELAVTDDGGRFELVLPPGERVLHVSAPWLVAQDVRVRLSAGERRGLTIEVSDDEAAAGEVIELGDRSASMALGARIDGAAARVTPGSGGDALRVVQSLPGVARPAAGSGDVVVWGASPRDTRILFDGAPVPFLYHPGGLRSFVPSAAVGGLELLPGAFPADRLGGIGGLVEVTSRDLPAELGAEAEVSVLDAGLSMHGRPRPGLRLGVATRMSHLDALLDELLEEEARLLVPVSVYTDAVAQLQLERRAGERLGIVALASGDRDERQQGTDPATARRREATRATARLIARYRRELAGGDHVEAVGWLGADRARQASATGELATSLEDRVRVAGARGGYVHLLGDAALVIGADLSAASHRLAHDGVATLPAREGDVTVFGQVPADEIATDRWRATQIEAATYARLDWQIGRVGLAPGLRVPAYLLSASDRLPPTPGLPPTGVQDQEVVLEPRVAVSVAYGDAIARLDVGRYHQPPDPADTSTVFGTPTLGLERAWHAALSISTWPLEALGVELVGYGRWADDLVVRSPDPAPPVAAAMVQDGSGRTLGVQLVARLRETAGLTGYVAYGLSRADREDPTHGTRQFDYDQTHTLTAVASWRHGPWTLGGRGRYVTGEPRTPVVGAYFDARAGRYQPELGAPSSIRLPALLQLDARVDRRFTAGDLALGGFVEVENVTGHRNVEEFIYSDDWTRQGELTGPPFLVLAGVTLEVR